MITHVITNLSFRAGAEAMLVRVVQNLTFRQQRVISLIEASPKLVSEMGLPAGAVQAYRANSLLGMLGAVVRLAAFLRRERPEAVLTWMYHANAITSLAAFVTGYRGPTIWGIRASADILETSGWSTKAAFFMNRVLCWHPARIIFNSKRSLDQHVAKGFPVEKCLYIPNGVKIGPLSEDLGRPIRRIGLAGRFHHHKDYATFLAAMGLVLASHPDVTVCAAGMGAEMSNPDFVALVNANGVPSDRIDARGHVADMDSFYSSIDLQVLSSVSEAFPNVLAEGMSHGVTCVTTDVGDAAAIVGETGRVVAIGDAGALARAILGEMELSPETIAARRMAAHERVASLFSIRSVGAAFRGVLDDFIQPALSDKESIS